MGKSKKNEKARAKYKKSRQNVKDAQEMKSIAAKSKGGKKATAYAGKQLRGAKSGLTRVSKNLQGGKSRQGSFKSLSKAASKSKPRKSAASAKQSMIRKESQKALSGKKVSSQKQRYIRSQQQEKMRIESSRGKGSKAKRRAALRR